MSVPIAERPLGVLAISAGLALIGAAVFSLSREKTGSIDGRAALESAFTWESLPFGFEITEAVVLPDGERIIVLADPDAPPEAPREVPPSDATPPDAPSEGAAPKRAWWQFFKSAPPQSQQDLPRKDWSKIAIGAKGAPPARAHFKLYPRDGGGERVRARFDGGDWRNIRDLDRMGGIVAVDAGKIPWGAFNPDFVHERSYEAGDTFRDSVTANLSVPGRPCTITLTWPRGVAGSRDAATSLLASLKPKDDGAAKAAQ